MMKSENKDAENNISGGLELPWEWAKDKIYPCLAPQGWEGAGKRSPVRREYLDLAIYYYIREFLDDGDTMLSIWIGEEDLKDWRMELDALEAQAMENVKLDGYVVERLGGIIDKKRFPHEPYVFTNHFMRYGAAAMLDVNRIAQFAAERNADLYILPSSIHEIMVVPIVGLIKETKVENQNRMVQEINQTIVPPEERLADHVYRYSRETGEIQIAR